MQTQETILYFFMYSFAFKIAFLATGILSMYWGFCLLRGGKEATKGRAGEETTKGDGEETTKIRITTPGLWFAVFGAALVVFALLYERPRLVLKHATKIHARSTAVTDHQPPSRNLEEIISLAVNYDLKKSYDKAASQYREALDLLAEPMNNLAYLYYRNGDYSKGLELAKVATSLTPGNEKNLGTLEMIISAISDSKETPKHDEKN